MIDPVVIDSFLGAAVRVATPLLLAALGEMIVERAGVINLGIEGGMLGGALASAIAAASFGPWTGLLAGAVAGAVIAIAGAAVTIAARADQIIAGTAITLGAVGLTGAIYASVFASKGVGFTLPTLAPVPIAGFDQVPFIGSAFFNQPVPTYLAILLVPAAWWFLFRTRAGLALRATGESAVNARAAGVPVARVQAGAVITGGVLAGLAGATLVLAQVGTFAERMTAGRGFIAIAIVVLGRWHPVGVLLASLLFGAATALQFAFQALGLNVPYQFFRMLPYVLTLALLAGLVGGVRPPAALGRPLP